MKIKYLKHITLIITMAFIYTNIKALDCTGVDKEGIFFQSKYEEGLMTPEEAKCWTTYIEEPINWDIDYWDRFDNLNRFDLGYHTFTYEDIRKLFTLGEFPRLKNIGVRNFCSGRKEEFPSVAFENRYLKKLFIGESHFKRLPDAFYEYGDSLEVLYVTDNPNFIMFSENIIKLKNVNYIHVSNVNISSVPSSVQNLNNLKSLYIKNINTFPDFPDLTIKKYNKYNSTLNLTVLWDYKQGCLDTMPVIVKEGTDSVIKSLSLTCIKNFPDNIAYLQSFQVNRPTIGHIDVTNQKALPENIEYLVIRTWGPYKRISIINPHRIRSLEPLTKMDVDLIKFHMTNGPLLPEDFERLTKELTKLKSIKSVRFGKGVPHNITDKTKDHLSQLDFLEALYFEDQQTGKKLEKYLPGKIYYRD